MAAYASTVHAAKVALDAALRAHSWPGDAPAILWGEPTDADTAGWNVVYQGAPEVDDEYLTLGATRLTENYDLIVVADVRRLGDDEQAVEALAFSDLHEIVKVVDADKTIGGTVNTVAGFRFTVASAPAGLQEWRTQITIRFAVTGYVYVV